jgi:hypothetical protein
MVHHHRDGVYHAQFLQMLTYTILIHQDTGRCWHTRLALLPVACILLAFSPNATESASDYSHIAAASQTLTLQEEVVQLEERLAGAEGAVKAAATLMTGE